MPVNAKLDVDVRDLRVLLEVIQHNPENKSLWRSVEKLSQKVQKKLDKEPNNG